MERCKALDSRIDAPKVPATLATVPYATFQCRPALQKKNNTHEPFRLAVEQKFKISICDGRLQQRVPFAFRIANIEPLTEGKNVAQNCTTPQPFQKNTRYLEHADSGSGTALMVSSLRDVDLLNVFRIPRRAELDPAASSG